MPSPLHLPKFVVMKYRRLRPILEWLPFTTGGALFCVASALGVWFFGVQRSDFILIVIGAVGLLISLVSVVFTIGFGVLLWRRYRVLDAGTFLLRVGKIHKVDVPLVVSWWMPLIQMSWDWVDMNMECSSDQSQEMLVPTRRGIWTNVVRKIRVGDAFGICAIQFTSTQPCTLKVLTEVLNPSLPRVLQGLQGGGQQAHPFGLPTGDRIDIRNYAKGDPVRYILWKVFARTGQLVVRTPEKAFEPVQRLLAYLVVHPADGSSAALCSAILNSNHLGENWTFGVDGYQGGCSDVQTALEVIVGSGNSEVNDGQGLEEFLTQQNDASSLLVFAPSTIGKWVEEVEALASRLPIQVCMVGQAPQKQSALETVLFKPRPLSLDEMDPTTVRQVIQRLEKAGVSVTLIFSNGTVLTSATFIQEFSDKGAA